MTKERALPSGAGVGEAIQPPWYYRLDALPAAPIDMDFAFVHSNPDSVLDAPERPPSLLVHTLPEDWS